MDSVETMTSAAPDMPTHLRADVMICGGTGCHSNHSQAVMEAIAGGGRAARSLR